MTDVKSVVVRACVKIVVSIDVRTSIFTGIFTLGFLSYSIITKTILIIIIIIMINNVYNPYCVLKKRVTD